jgi:hypothetical protein
MAMGRQYEVKSNPLKVRIKYAGARHSNRGTGLDTGGQFAGTDVFTVEWNEDGW